MEVSNNQRLVFVNKPTKVFLPKDSPPATPRRPCLTRVGTSADTDGIAPKAHYRLVILGAGKVGKTAIVHQFLYDRFVTDYSATVEELHRGEYEIGDYKLTLDILDTSGSYEFPAMRRLAIGTGDAFVLVYSIDNLESFEEIRNIRQELNEQRPTGAPLVVVGNKSDLDQKRVVQKELAETMACIDWENGFVECSAKTGHNVLTIFNELLVQANIKYRLSPVVQRRRMSLPVNPRLPGGKSKTGKRNSCAVS